MVRDARGLTTRGRNPLIATTRILARPRVVLGIGTARAAVGWVHGHARALFSALF